MQSVFGPIQNQMLPAQDNRHPQMLPHLPQMDILRPEQQPDVILGADRDLDGNHGGGDLEATGIPQTECGATVPDTILGSRFATGQEEHSEGAATHCFTVRKLSAISRQLSASK